MRGIKLKMFQLPQKTDGKRFGTVRQKIQTDTFFFPLFPNAAVLQRMNMLNENQVLLAWQQSYQNKEILLSKEEITLKGIVVSA